MGCPPAHFCLKRVAREGGTPLKNTKNRRKSLQFLFPKVRFELGWRDLRVQILRRGSANRAPKTAHNFRLRDQADRLAGAGLAGGAPPTARLKGARELRPPPPSNSDSCCFQK